MQACSTQQCSASVDTAEKQPHKDPTGTENADYAVSQVVDLNVIVVGRIRHCGYKDKHDVSTVYIYA